MINDSLLTIITFIKGLDPLSMYIGGVTLYVLAGVASGAMRKKGIILVLLIAFVSPAMFLVLLVFPSVRRKLLDD